MSVFLIISVFLLFFIGLVLALVGTAIQKDTMEYDRKYLWKNYDLTELDHKKNEKS